MWKRYCSAIIRKSLTLTSVVLLWQESRFDAQAVSPKRAEGIAQFMPATASWHQRAPNRCRAATTAMCRLNSYRDPVTSAGRAEYRSGRL
jgi:Transglycosylase SLT domain